MAKFGIHQGDDTPQDPLPGIYHPPTALVHDTRAVQLFGKKIGRGQIAAQSRYPTNKARTTRRNPPGLILCRHPPEDQSPSAADMDEDKNAMPGSFFIFSPLEFHQQENRYIEALAARASRRLFFFFLAITITLEYSGQGLRALKNSKHLLLGLLVCRHRYRRIGHIIRPGSQDTCTGTKTGPEFKIEMKKENKKKEKKNNQ
ncbi:hypothetical protein QBC32DRAFT_332824 [Pseudoneurospora amorphoporcata]|uniref:Uncharacterized protein n=1 Tax=Pseudoneurospora amorphoporcata TaxID=241081 RepID=A0AAN6P0V9_9PEZI|nr:hypothetical protein QBC32DRAFT_332824 [Pseudoneurospora amorphoporcata]